MTAPVDTSAEAVRRHDPPALLAHEIAFMQECMAAHGLPELDSVLAERMLVTIVTQQQRLSEQETLLAARNQQNAAAFTASDAYQKRCEQGDALLSRVSRVYADFGILTTDLRQTIDAHLAGEDMAEGEGK